MAYNKNLNIGPNNVVNISGSFVTVTGSLSGTQISGTTSQFTIVSASIVSASTYYGFPTSSGGGNPGGADTNIQFNKLGAFSGSNNLIYNYNTNTLSGTTSQFTTLTASHISGTDLKINYIDFNTSLANPGWTQNGRLQYNIDTGDLAYDTSVTDVRIEIGQQTVVKVKNASGSPINKGKLVRISGGQGVNPLITTASWENDSNSANTLGMVLQTVNQNDFTFVLLNGVIEKINLDPATYSAGDILYLSSSGDYTKIKPAAPRHTVKIGEVVTAHQNNGVAFINIQNGYEIDELHNVSASSAVNGDLLVYDSSTAVWKNTKVLSDSYQISGNLIVTGSTTVSTISGTTAQFTAITGSRILIEGPAAFSGSMLIYGTASLSQNPTAAYLIYSSSLDKLFAYPGLYVSGNITGSGHAKFNEISGTTAQFTIISASVISASSYVGPIGGGSGTPGGTNQSIQFNSGSTFSGSSNLVWDYINERLGVGITNPSAKLNVLGNFGVSVPDTTSINLSASSGGGYSLNVTVDSTGGKIQTNSSTRDLRLGTNNTTALTIDTSQNIGIGTTNPTSKLSVLGNFGVSNSDTTAITLNPSNGGGYSLAISADSTGGKITTNVSTRDLQIGTNNTTALTIDTSQRVGIGTTNPTSKLYIEGGSANWNETTQGKAVGTIHLDPGSSTDNYGNAITFGASDDSGAGADAQAGIYVRSDGTYGTKMYFATSNNYTDGSKNRMMIDHLGNIGIGTSNPNYTLDVIGQGSFQNLIIDAAPGGGNDSSLFFNARTNGNSVSNVARFVADAANNTTDAKFKLQMIDADGGGWDDGFTFQASPDGDDHTYVGIGTTSPTVRLDIVGNGTTAARFSSGNVIISNNLSVNGGQISSSAETLTVIAGTTVDIKDNTIISGNLTVTSTITELSTRRIKTNIESLNNQLTTISKLNPVSYTRIDDGRKEYGFISEEVKEVYPEFVVGEGINYPKMVSVLVSAVKELTEKVEKQQNEIALLKNKKKITRGKK